MMSKHTYSKSIESVNQSEMANFGKQDNEQGVLECSDDLAAGFCRLPSQAQSQT